MDLRFLQNRIFIVVVVAVVLIVIPATIIVVNRLNKTDDFTIQDYSAGSSIGNFNVLTKGHRSVQANIEGFTYPTELTPLVFKVGNNEREYIFGTSWSWGCESNSKLSDSDVLIARSKCKLITKPEVLDSVDERIYRYKDPSQVNTMAYNYTYDGVTGVSSVLVNGKNYVIVARHNESTNVKHDEKFYQAGINPDVEATNCYSGYINNKWHTCWDSFHQFNSIAIAEYGPDWKENLVDQGPVIWPSKGYKTSNSSAGGTGFYVPTLFTDYKSGYIYMYFVNNNDLNEYGQQQCISVARSFIGDLGKSGRWYNYYQGKFETSSLPKEFRKNDISNLYSLKGNPADCINRPDSKNIASTYFSVAKLDGTDYYISVEEGAVNDKTWQMGVRFSKDLVNWSDIYVLSTANSAWGEGEYTYPTFLDKYSSTTNRVDPSEFYIMGKAADLSASGENANSYSLNLLKISISQEDGIPFGLTRDQRYVIQYYKHLLGWDMNLENNREAIDYHVNKIVEEGFEADIKEFVKSDTFLDNSSKMSNAEFVAILYRALLSRDPDNKVDGSNWWVANLDSNSMTRDQAIDAMFDGWEPAWVYETEKYYGS